MTSAAERPPQEVLKYAAVLADRLLSALDGEVCAVYLHGSAVLGGWRAAVSDVDVLAVLPHQLGPDSADVLASAAVATVPACPGTGLEMSAVSCAEAAAPQPPWRFVAHVAAAYRGERRVILGAGHPGDPDLLLHYAVCRAAGWPVFGPPAAALIGPVLRPAVLDALARELIWGLEHRSAPYGLLNACRALLYLQDRLRVAKTTGGRWAIDQGIGPSTSIARDLAAQAGTEPAGTLTEADVEFVLTAASRLAEAGKSEEEPVGRSRRPVIDPMWGNPPAKLRRHALSLRQFRYQRHARRREPQSGRWALSRTSDLGIVFLMHVTGLTDGSKVDSRLHTGTR